MPQTRCPRLFIYNNAEAWNRIIDAYNGYKSGFLPMAGGMGEQGGLFSRYMFLVESTLDHCRDVEKSRQEASQKAGMNVAHNRGRSLLGRR